MGQQLTHLFQFVFAFALLMIGMWTSFAWTHKQIYIFKNALNLKKHCAQKNIDISLLECFWRMKDFIEPEKRTEIEFEWSKK